MKTEEIQKQVLKLVKIFDEVCEENNIKYTLAAGSVLGAVRHKGFIPWDPDMDVIVPINQFDLLREKLNERIAKEKNLKLYQWDKEPKYYEVVDRFCIKNIPHQSLHLDIFPLIGAPSDIKKQKRFVKKCFYSYKFLRSKNCDTNFSNPNHVKYIKIMKIFAHVFSDKFIINWYNKLQKKYDLDTCEYAYILSSGYGINELLKKDVFLDTYKTNFEDAKLSIPRQYDYYLKQIYGNDYMTPKKTGYKEIIPKKRRNKQ